jgi:phosphoenolpyruvate-protein phosphotransferase
MRLRGSPAAPGVAVGPIWTWRTAPTSDSSPDPTVSDLEEAVAIAAGQLRTIATQLRSIGRADEAEILEAQALMASDPLLLSGVRDLLAQGSTAPQAVRAAAEAFAEQLASLPDATLAARASDVRDVGARIARILLGHRIALPERPSVAIADDLPPSITAEVPFGLILGIVLSGGSTTSHAAILARSFGIPAVVGVTGLERLLSATNGSGPLTGRMIALDGDTGDVVVDPGDSDLAGWANRAAASSGPEPDVRTPVATRDGRHVGLLANIGRPEEARLAIDAGAEGVGLFRTEFLFLERMRAPTEVEQVAAYRHVMDAFGPERPVVVRLADIGGDKQLPYLDLPTEQNPFLGVRAIRLAATHPELLVTQIRAVLRAAAAARVTPHIMAPMVATLEDIDLLERLVAEARQSLPASEREWPGRPRLGIMIEVPAAAVLIQEMARRVDFVSVGTNDLTQYLFAADRTNPRLSAYQRADHPALLRTINAIVVGAEAAGIPVAVCGELAGDPGGARHLVGLGVTELSMAPRSISRVAQAIAASRSDELRREAEAALAV